MEDHPLREDTGRVIGLALAVWAAAVAIAATEGALERFDGASLAAFAALVSAYAVAAYRLDPLLREYPARFGPAPVRALAVACAAALAASLAMGSPAFAIFFAPPAALALAAAARTPARATSASSAKSPGATPAAT